MPLIPWTKLLIYGVCAGVVGVIPGLSIGTMMVVLGLYQQTVHAVSSLRRQPRLSLRFLIPLGIGAMSGVFVFSHLITRAMDLSPVITQYFFIGLLLGTLPMLYRKTSCSGIRLAHVIAFSAALFIMLFTIFVIPDRPEQIMETVTLLSALKLVLTGCLAAISMIVPGISGSFILVVLGSYTTILWAVSQLKITILLPVAVGCLLGLVIGARAIDRLLTRFPSLTYAAILGLVFGSIPSLYPGFPMTLEGLGGLLSLAVGAALAIWFSSPHRHRISRHLT